MRLLLPRLSLRHILPAAAPDAQRFGAIESALLKLLALPATVIEVHKPADRFRLITIEGEALRNVRWQPGQKIQMRLGGFTARTYTPLLWDGTEGVVQILTYLHYQMVATTPGTIWAASARAGDACQLSGPRGSLDLPALQRPVFFFGDETSIGLARALKTTAGGYDGVSFVLEVSSPPETHKVLDALNLPGMTLVKRARDDFHLSQVEAAMLEAIESGTPWQFVLSGKGRSVQRLTRFLRLNNVPASQVDSRAYWAPGKTGMD